MTAETRAMQMTPPNMNSSASTIGRVNCRGIAIAVIAVLLLPGMLAASETTPDESWLVDDGESRALQVNEGQLNFIAPVRDKSTLHSDTHLSITAESMKTGWVAMQQCYRHLDAVNRTDVVYAYREMIDLRVIEADKIAKVRVNPDRVELEDVANGAELCVQAKVRILQRVSDRAYRMRNGPYHRKFLDGYYPFHVSLTVNFPHHELQLERVQPGAQDGFHVTEKTGKVFIDSWFEGELRIELTFSQR
jgi:hypothetical protein